MYNCVLNPSTMKYDTEFIPLKFGVKTFSIIMFIWMCLTTVSFAILHWFVPIEYKSTRKVQQNVTINELDPLCVFYKFECFNLLICLEHTK